MRTNDKDKGEYAILNIRVPRELHRLVLLHRVETGEDATKLVNRLLVEELIGDVSADVDGS